MEAEAKDGDKNGGRSEDDKHYEYQLFTIFDVWVFLLHLLDDFTLSEEEGEDDFFLAIPQQAAQLVATSS